MKKWMLATSATVAFLTAFTASAAAPDQKTAHPGARQAIYQSWSLSDQQKNQLTNENKAFHERLTALKDQSFDSIQARHEAMKEAARTHHEALARVLNDEQRRVLEGLDQRAAAMQTRGALRAALLDSWKLDDTQRQALDDSRRQMRRDLAELRHDKGAMDSRKDRRQAMATLHEQQHARLSRVLSAEQIRVLEMIRHVELRGPKGKPPIDVRHALVKSWHLEALQVDAMKAAAKELHQKMAQLKDMDASQDSDRRHRMIEARTAFHHSLEDILSQDQLAALDSVSRHHHPAMGPRHHGADQNAPLKPDQS
ncbi:hypothetical protein [Kushneria phyllosphaerae]|uniref:LTXXQ motif family protein n=1 Tax=Kushneria phyllosphaerae TaxID=2100822 RepID=A0A2R8CLT5_9GAMM|nr:hypothetical protein [Kushneria phyllosphaerae]SPJ33858.1 hypothetical protein KSP9073_01882 [Kushneria phyllosphaerae]